MSIPFPEVVPLRPAVRISLLLLLFLLCSAVVGQAQFGLSKAATDFVDPSGLFSVKAPPGWEYQAELSAPGFAVFYGTGDYDLFYVDIVGPGSAALTPGAQAQAAVEQYAGPTGLTDFALINAPSPGALGGRQASYIVYSYTDSSGVSIVEGRVFAVVGNDVYTLAFADAADRFDANVALFNGVMESFAIVGPQTTQAPASGAAPAVGTAAASGGTPASGGARPGQFYSMAVPVGWELWEEQATARGDVIEPWHSLLNWPGKPITKSLFIWDFFDEWLQTGAQYEILAAVIENVPGTQADAVEQLTNVAAGASAGTYEGVPQRVRLGAEAAFAVKIGVRPGRTELWSEGIPWHREVTFYVLKRGTTLFVLAVPDAIVGSPELTAALQSFVWLAR